MMRQDTVVPTQVSGVNASNFHLNLLKKSWPSPCRKASPVAWIAPKLLICTLSTKQYLQFGHIHNTGSSHFYTFMTISFSFYNWTVIVETSQIKLIWGLARRRDRVMSQTGNWYTHLSSHQVCWCMYSLTGLCKKIYTEFKIVVLNLITTTSPLGICPSLHAPLHL